MPFTNSEKDSLLKDIVKEEGFRSKVYTDTMGVLTFGHGLTLITEEESLWIVKRRIKEAEDWVDAFCDREKISLDNFRKLILAHMSYQLGTKGVESFKKMIQALRNMDYDLASDEMKNSKWHIQSPARCERLAKKMKMGC